MIDTPFTFNILRPERLPSRVDNYIQRRMSPMRGQYFCEQAFEQELMKRSYM
jgi:hypothetical protein